MTWMFLYFVGCVPVVVLLMAGVWRRYGMAPSGQHAGFGEGALTVEYLIERVERERARLECTGRHALRDPVLLRAVA